MTGDFDHLLLAPETPYVCKSAGGAVQAAESSGLEREIAWWLLENKTKGKPSPMSRILIVLDVTQQKYLFYFIFHALQNSCGI